MYSNEYKDLYSKYTFLTNIRNQHIAHINLAAKLANAEIFIFNEAYDQQNNLLTDISSVFIKQHGDVSIFNASYELREAYKEWLHNNLNLSYDEMEDKDIYINCEYEYWPELANKRKRKNS